MNTLEIIKLVATIVVVLFLVIYFLVKAIRNGWLNKIYDAAVAAIKEAEASGKSGAEKKQYVLHAVETKCHELGIPYALIHKLVSKLIDTIISHYNVVSK